MPNRKDSPDRSAFSLAKCTFCIREYRKAESFSCEQSTLSEKHPKRCTGGMEIRFRHTRTGNDNHIIPIPYFRFHQTVIFFNQTPHTVSCNGVSDFFADGNTQAALTVSVLFEVYDQKAGRLRTAFVIQTPKFMVLSYRYRLLHRILRTKNLSSSASSSGENLAAVSRAHSLSEAMLLLSVPLGRLICLKHKYTSFCFASAFLEQYCPCP